MKNKLTSFLVLATALTTASHAQLTLHNFSDFESPRTSFFGEWSDDPFGSPIPVSLFSQGAGFYSFGGVTNNDFSYVEYSFTSSLDLGAYDQLSLSLRLLDGNTADSVTVSLFDSSYRAAFATFQTSDFTANASSEISLFFTADVGFDVSDVSLFRIGGNDPFGGGLLSVEIDNLASIGGAPSAVPEPSTYGLIGAAVLAGVAAYRERRKA